MDVLGYKYWCDLPENIEFNFTGYALIIKDCYIKSYNIKLINIIDNNNNTFSITDYSSDIKYIKDDRCSYRTENCSLYTKINVNDLQTGWYVVVVFDNKEDFAKFKILNEF